MTSDHLLWDGSELLCPELRSSSGHRQGLHHKMWFGSTAAASSVFLEKIVPSKQIAPNMFPAAGQTGLDNCKRELLPPVAIHPGTLDRHR